MEIQQNKFELIIKADSVISTDKRFTIDNIGLGNEYKPLDSYFKSANGNKITRTYAKGERKNSNQTLPRIACQIYEKELVALSNEEKEEFPTCQYSPNAEIIRGIFYTVEDFRKRRNSIEYLIYRSNDVQFVIYCWNIFSTIKFVQECLKRFGEKGDQFVLTYCEKKEKIEESLVQDEFYEYRNEYSSMLVQSKNIILRGAPGTGKSYLAKKIAADIISNGESDDFESLTDEEKNQVEFVQFHPSYDYSDFVEGLRPKLNPDGSMGFELQEGIFYRFITRARENREELKKYIFIIDEINRGEISKIFGELFFSIDLGYRGRAGEVSTQYANMHADSCEKFYIPDNVYIIGTMNDIDRSVDSFDFAMRRRFRFIEIKADKHIQMLDLLDEDVKKEAIRRMASLNKEILTVDDLNENYQIGAAYFLKLKFLNFDELWTDCLCPLLQDYIRGMYDEEGIMTRLAKAYGYKKVEKIDDSMQD